MYSDSRISMIVIIASLVAQAFVFFFGFNGFAPIPMTIGLTLIILIAFLSLFSLRITVDQEYVKLIYGIGLYVRTIPIPLVSNTEIVPNNYLTWIYDTKREHVLRIELRDGSTAVIGIGDPRQLTALLSRRR